MTRRGRLLAIGAALVALALLALLTIAIFGVSVDASRWREAIAARATAALGRPVALDGPLELRFGRTAALHIAGVRILNPPGFSSAELATLGKARASIDLLAALRGRVLVHSFEAADARVRFERAADGRANWAPQAGGAAAPAVTDGPALPQVAIEIERTSIRNFAVVYRDQRSGKRHSFYLDELAGAGKWSEPLKLTLQGRVDRKFPYTIAIEGGSARLLQEAGEPWPFTLDFEFLGTRLHATGTVDGGQGTARFEFGAGTENLEQVERFVEEKLPKFGVAALTGKVVASADALEVSELHGVLGDSELAGRLALTLGGLRRRLAGELEIATLDLRPFLDSPSGKRDEPLTYDDLARQSLPLRGLVPVDADLVVRVGRWVGLVGDARDARLDVHADERGARASVAATVAGVPLTGHTELDAAAATPMLALELGARNSPLGGLAEMLTGAAGVDGTLGRLELRLAGRGETLGEAVRDLELRLAVAAARLSYGNVAGGRPVEFTLDTLDVSVPRGQQLRGTARGTLRGERATAAIRGGELPRILRELAMPIEVDLAAAGATARIEGVLARPEAARGTDVAFRLDARRAGDLARWLGVAPDAKLPLALSGRARAKRDQWHLDETTLKVGRSALTVDAHRTVVGGRPIIVAAVRSPLVDLPELETLRAKPAAAPARRVDASIDVPILPHGIELADADIGLGLDRVVLGRAELVDLGFGARIRDGYLAPAPFAARLADVPFEGLAGLDLRSDVPEASIAMSTGKVDVGALLRRLGVAEDLDASADALQVELLGRGSRLSELTERSSFEARLLGGSLAVPGPGKQPIAIKLTEAVLGAPPGKRIAARLDGALDQTPVEIRIESGTLADFARDASRVPFSVAATAAGARLTLEGEAALPLGRGGQLTLEVAGERLDSLSPLARVDLPRWGPWSIRGPITMTATGYEVSKLAVRVGESRLNGRGRLDVTGARPRLDVRVSAPRIQLNDFPRPARSDAPRDRNQATTDALRATAKGAATQTQTLLSAAFLRRFDAYVDVTVRQVLSGSDRLGDGWLRAQLIDGRLYLGPAEVNLPGGTARLTLAYDPTTPELTLSAGAYIERFDYGILARRALPGTDAEGLFSLTLELAGKAPRLDAIMAHADGRIDFAVWPKNLSSGVFDLWAVNVFLALLPAIDPAGDPLVNCAVGRFDLRDGKLTHDALLIDTSRMRVAGAGGVDFDTEALAFRFQPRAKGLQLFSLQTPVSVTGTLTDFTVGVSAGDALGTIARFLGSVIVVPLERLTQGPLPRDGADVCTDPLRAVGGAKR